MARCNYNQHQWRSAGRFFKKLFLIWDSFHCLNREICLFKLSFYFSTSNLTDISTCCYLLPRCVHRVLVKKQMVNVTSARIAYHHSIQPLYFQKVSNIFHISKFSHAISDYDDRLLQSSAKWDFQPSLRVWVSSCLNFKKRSFHIFRWFSLSCRIRETSLQEAHHAFWIRVRNYNNNIHNNPNWFNIAIVVWTTTCANKVEFADPPLLLEFAI